MTLEPGSLPFVKLRDFLNWGGLTSCVQSAVEIWRDIRASPQNLPLGKMSSRQFAPKGPRPFHTSTAFARGHPMSRPRSPRVRGGNIFNECSSEDGSHHSGTAFEGFTTFAVDGGLLAFRSENSYSDLSQLARASPSMSRLVSPDSIISQTPSVNKWYQRSDVAAPPMLRAGRSPAASPLCEPRRDKDCRMPAAEDEGRAPRQARASTRWDYGEWDQLALSSSSALTSSVATKC